MSERMPAGIGNAYAFQAFNTMSFGIVVGLPMILFFKHLEVSATVLGIVLALPPLLNTLQIPAASIVERVGYRPFVLRGWTLRCFVILGMAGVAFLPEAIDRTTKTALMLLMLFAYNASRGFSSCGFLPWLTQLVPESLRGRYLARDQMSSALALLGTMLATTWFVSWVPGAVGFGCLFIASFVAGMVSLSFLAKIPDVPVAPAAQAQGPVPWKAMLFHPPFFRLLLYNVITTAALAGGGVFWVPLLRDVHGFQDWQFLAMMALFSAGSALTLFGFGALADRVGSKPLLGLSGLVLAAHFGLWTALAGGTVAPTWGVMVMIQLSAAVGLALFTLPNTRLTMAVVPEMGRSHFFALYSVVISLTAGIFPVLWGLLLDSLKGWQVQYGDWQCNQYSFSYAALLLVYLVAQIFQARLVEPKAMPTDVFLHELLVKTPSRALTRLITRRPMG